MNKDHGPFLSERCTICGFEFGDHKSLTKRCPINGEGDFASTRFTPIPKIKPALIGSGGPFADTQHTLIESARASELKAHAVEFANRIKELFPVLTVEHGHWVIESQISTEQLYDNLFNPKP